MEEPAQDNLHVSLEEERLRLEREALAVERERLAAARAHAEAEAQIAKSRRTVPIAVSVTLLALLSFAGGVFTGFAIMEGRQQRQREARLAQALSQLGPFASNVQTNETGSARSSAGRRDVSVVVIQ
jgi:hypothetical protein